MSNNKSDLNREDVITRLPLSYGGISFADIEAAEARIAPYILRTPLLRSIELDRATGAEVFVKPECLQLTGAFKLRGAFNRLCMLSDEEKSHGVVSCSSGNHGQAVAYAAKTLGMHAVIVMPKDAPRIKIEKTRSHGAEIVHFDRDTESRENIAAEISARTGAVFVSPYDDPYVIAGQGTSALEAMQDIAALDGRGIDNFEGHLDAYLAAAGGGGLLAGSALVVRHLSPETEIFSVEPEGHDDHARSFEAGERASNAPGQRSICDALLTPTPGELTFQVNRALVTGGLRVSDDEVKSAMRFALENLKIIAEPGGAATLAAVLSGKMETKGKSIGLIISGGNVDPALLCEMLTE